MRILFAGNLLWRSLGGIGFNPDRKMYAGLVKSGHTVWEFSDRDMTRLDTPLGLKPLGVRHANRKFIDACVNFEPDLVVLALADILTNETIAAVRRALPSVRICHWNVDPLFSQENVSKIEQRAEVCDSLFVTSGGPRLKALARPGCFSAYIPNPSDTGSEYLNNAERDSFDHDLIYFGVGNPSDSRWALVEILRAELQGVRFSTFGSHGGAKLLGRARDKVLERTKMALNLNREEGVHLYSSDRISYLMPNGIVTLISARSGLQQFFAPDEAVFFEDADHMRREIAELQKDDARRKQMAAKGRAKYHALFDSKRVANYLIETALSLPPSADYEWADEVYRA